MHIHDVLVYLKHKNLTESLYTLEIETHTSLVTHSPHIAFVRSLVLQGAFSHLLALVEVFYKTQKDRDHATVLILKTQVVELASRAETGRDLDTCKQKLEIIRRLADQQTFEALAVRMANTGEQISVLSNRMEIFDFLLPKLAEIFDAENASQIGNFQQVAMKTLTDLKAEIGAPKLSLLATHRESCPVRTIKLNDQAEIFFGANHGGFCQLDAEMKMVDKFPIHQGSVYCCDELNGVWATGSNDGRIGIFSDFCTPKFLDEAEAGTVRSVKWIADNVLFSGACKEAAVRRWDVTHESIVDRILLSEDEYVLGLAISSENWLTAATSKDNLKTFDLRSTEMTSEICVPGVFTCASLTGQLLCGSENGAVSLWDLRNHNTPVWEMQTAHCGPVRGVCGYGSLAMSVSFDKSLKLFSVADGKELGQWSLDQKLVACDMKQQRVVVSGADGGCFLFALN